MHPLAVLGGGAPGAFIGKGIPSTLLPEAEWELAGGGEDRPRREGVGRKHGGGAAAASPPPPRPPSHVFDSDAILSAAQKLAIDGGQGLCHLRVLDLLTRRGRPKRFPVQVERSVSRPAPDTASKS